MTETNEKKVIGVIGGIGPEASANLYIKMIHYMQKKYNAVQDADYPPMIIYNVPMKGFDETGIVDGELVKLQLINAANKLQAAGAEVVMIACNTVHHFQDDIISAINIPFLSIIEETSKRAQTANYKNVGILCSQSTNDLKLYNQRFLGENTRIFYCNPEQQNIVNGVIESVMAGTHGLREIRALNAIIYDLERQGAEVVILGCTELPLAITQQDCHLPLFDSLNIIIEESVNFSLSKKVSQ